MTKYRAFQIIGVKMYFKKFILIKYPQHKIDHLSHFGVYSSVVLNTFILWNFPGDSDGKESACKKKKKNLPAMQETRVQSLGLEDPLEKGMAAHSNILAWEIPWTEEPGRLQSRGVTKSWARLSD